MPKFAFDKKRGGFVMTPPVPVPHPRPPVCPECRRPGDHNLDRSGRGR